MEESMIIIEHVVNQTEEVMTEELHIGLHQDHRKWTSDLEMWAEDLKMWHEELEALNTSLIYIGRAVTEHEEALGSHENSLNGHRKMIVQHEKDITYLPEGSSLDNTLIEVHKKERENHKVQYAAHERLKKFHHRMMVLTKELKQALEVMD